VAVRDRGWSWLTPANVDLALQFGLPKQLGDCQYEGLALSLHLC
jgi:hypothetical protein